MHVTDVLAPTSELRAEATAGGHARHKAKTDTHQPARGPTLISKQRCRRRAWRSRITRRTRRKPRGTGSGCRRSSSVRKIKSAPTAPSSVRAKPPGAATHQEPTTRGVGETRAEPADRTTVRPPDLMLSGARVRLFAPQWHRMPGRPSTSASSSASSARASTATWAPT